MAESLALDRPQAPRPIPGAHSQKRDHERAIADYRKALSLKIDEPNKKQIETAFGAIG
jgi:hypothetical protein